MSHQQDDDSPAAVRQRRARRRILIIAAAAAIVLIGVVTAASIVWARASTSAHRFGLADAAEAPVALVLGAGLRPDGTPSPALRARLGDAVSLYQKGTVEVLLVSGDNGTADHDEPTAMRDYLVAQGVPASRVVLDYAGFSTWDSCVRAREVFGIRRVLVVTQEFHLPRAVFLCRHAGLDVDGAAGEHPDVDLTSFALREIPADVKAAWSAIARPSPKYLGPHETGVDDALAG